MRRSAMITAFAVIATLPILLSPSAAGQAPKDWKLRADRSTNASDPDAPGDIKLAQTGAGFHAIAPEAAVFWNPRNTLTGNYSLKATFTLISPASHVEYYGLIFGGSDLDGQNQSYLYFMVAQNGTWLIKRRQGDDTENVSAKTPSDAVKMPDAGGKAINTLEVRVAGDKIDYLVNGKVVQTTPKSGPTAKTDGVYGFRVNHHLEVQVDAFGASPL